MNFLSNFFESKQLKHYQKLVEEINSKETPLEKLSLEALRVKSDELKGSVREGKKSLNAVLPEAFALVQVVSKRTLGQRHYNVQLLGGVVLHEGKIAEMLTGEGKTLASTAPVYLNALSGKGVHVVTVNDYLARRDAVWMGQIYHALGLSVSCIIHEDSFIYDPNYLPEEKALELDRERDIIGSFRVVEKFLRPASRKEAYQTDITYGTNHHFGFDYLRDNMIPSFGEEVQRGHNFVIIDEVDSILIDEARTPLIISTPDKQSSELYKTFTHIVKNLNKDSDYELDEKHRSVNLTDAGVEKAEKMAGVENIFDPENARLVHYLDESLKAKELFHKDKEYVVRGTEIVIVDQFTGHLMFGRRYSGGLHQAIEAKEGVPVKEESKTYAQITIQNYFRLYDKVSGMTGTAETSAEEFEKVYGLEVIKVPPNKPIVRNDMSDIIYKTKAAKFKAVVEDAKKRHEKGQPLLLGTTSIENNEVLSVFLKKAGVSHEVLNAKNNEREGEIIAQAGKSGAVTVATNVAGRGVDIVLGGNPPELGEADKVKQLGGLHIIGTERHEARRIDNQLRGRSGRQGDSGSSQFFLSLEDDLLRVFGGEKISGIMSSLKVPEDLPIESGLVSKAVNQAQQKVEGMNLDMRQHLLDFDDVLNKQRTYIYEKRKDLLKAGVENKILPYVREAIEGYAEHGRQHIQGEIDDLRSQKASEEEVKKREEGLKMIDESLKKIPSEIEPERAVILAQHLTRIQDALWVGHLDNLQALRESVNIRAFGQKDPLVEYRKEAHMLFGRLKQGFEALTYKSAFSIFEMDIEKAKRNVQANEEQRRQSAIRAQTGSKIGRNDPCWCGSGKKYKKCHGQGA